MSDEMPPSRASAENLLSVFKWQVQATPDRVCIASPLEKHAECAERSNEYEEAGVSISYSTLDQQVTKVDNLLTELAVCFENTPSA
jgi:hypothetical protein